MPTVSLTSRLWRWCTSTPTTATVARVTTTKTTASWTARRCHARSAGDGVDALAPIEARVREVTSGPLGFLAPADDLLAGASRHVDPRVTLIVSLGGARARRVGRLTVVLAGLADAETLLGLELRLRRGTGGVRHRCIGHRERGGHRGSDEQGRRLHGSRTSSVSIVSKTRAGPQRVRRSRRGRARRAVSRPR